MELKKTITIEAEINGGKVLIQRRDDGVSIGFFNSEKYANLVATVEELREIIKVAESLMTPVECK